MDNVVVLPSEVVKRDGQVARFDLSKIRCAIAKAGTATPDKKPACPGDLTYFENSKKGQMGCRV